MSDTNGAEWLNLNRFGLSKLSSIVRVPLNTEFLSAAIGHWNMGLHIFQFNGLELCPTLEEFCDILGYDSASLPMLPPTDPINVPRDLASFLGIPVGLASHFTHGGLVNLPALIAF